MSEAWSRLFTEGKRAWPGVDLDEPAFVEHAQARASETHLGSLHAPDLYLACACGRGDAKAIAAFEARYMIEVPLFLRERRDVIVEEVQQLVRERLFVGERPKILEYGGRGTLGSWLRVVTLRVASNHRRSGREAKHDPVDAAEVLPAVDAELAWIKGRYKEAFNDSLRAALAELEPRDRTLFRMHFVEGLSIDRIGVVFRVHRATVARWIATARATVLERTMARLGERLSLRETELASLLRVVRTSLDVSLQALLVE